MATMDPSGFAGRGKPQQQEGQRSSTGKGEGRKVTPMRPVSIRMLKQAEVVGEGVMTVNGREISQVVVCGQIVKHENAVAGMNTGKVFGYILSDGTDAILVKQWYDQSQGLVQLPVDTYVRFIGTVKMFKGEPQVTGQATPMNSLNEFMYHKLDVLATHLRLTKGTKQLPQADAPAGSASPGANRYATPGMQAAGVPPQRQAYGTMPAPGGVAAAPQQAAPGGATDVPGAIKQCLSDGGVWNLDSLQGSLRSMGVSLTAIRQSLSQMMMSGEVIETPDGFQAPYQ